MQIAKVDFSWMGEPCKSICEELQAKILALLPTKDWTSDDELLSAATGGDRRFDGIFICQECRKLYHTDYSTNSDPDRDFCYAECELAFFRENPQTEYNGELQPNPWRYELEM